MLDRIKALMSRLISDSPILGTIRRLLMPRLEVDPALVGDISREAPPKFDLTYTAAVLATPINGPAQVTFAFPAYNILDVTLPSKVHVCAFKPGTVIPATGAEVFALAGQAIGTSTFPGHDPILGDDAPAQEVTVSVDLKSLFAGRETEVKGVFFVPVREYAE